VIVKHIIMIIRHQHAVFATILATIALVPAMIIHVFHVQLIVIDHLSIANVCATIIITKTE
jgi:hypothetical protein